PAAGGDHPGIFADLSLYPSDHALDEAHVPEDYPRLHRRRGVVADDALGRDEVNSPQHGRPLDQRLGREANARGNGATEVVAVSRDHVEDGRCAQVDDDKRWLVHMERCHGIDDAVWANLAWVFVKDAQA